MYKVQRYGVKEMPEVRFYNQDGKEIYYEDAIKSYQIETIKNPDYTFTEKITIVCALVSDFYIGRQMDEVDRITSELFVRNYPECTGVTKHIENKVKAIKTTMLLDSTRELGTIKIEIEV